MRIRKSATNDAAAALAVAWLPSMLRRLLEQGVQSVDVPRLAALLGFKDVPGPAEYSKLRPATRLLLIGLSAWIVLVVAITTIAVVSVEMSTVSFSTWFGGPTSAAVGSKARARSGYENIIQRPLFSRSRHAAVVAAPMLPAPPAPVQLDQNFSLKGVFINGPKAKAFLITSQDPAGVWVQNNEEIAGWRVVAIKPDQVVLDGQNQKLVVPLSINGGVK